MRVLHLPADIGGMAWSLSRAERQLGFGSDVLVRSAAPQDPTNAVADRFVLADKRNPAQAALNLAGAFWRIRREYDVFHFNFGSSLLHAQMAPVAQPELSLYPRSAKVFATYNGCDARQKYPTMSRGGISACQEDDCYGGMCNSGKRDERRRAGIDRMAERAAHIWAVNPDLLRFLPAEKSSFLPYAISPPALTPVPPRADGPLRVVHAPTQRGAKGTRYVLQAFDEIKSRHPGDFDFELVEGVTRQQALERYARADVVVDQLLVGWYGAVAVEAMWLGKAVMAYVREDDLPLVPAAMAEQLRAALWCVTKDSLVEALLEAAADRGRVQQIGVAGLAYAARWHHPAVVAAETTQAYRNAA